MIPFTLREMSRAYRAAQKAAEVHTRTNVHRLLLFYSAECGLKAAYMRRNSMTVLNEVTAKKFEHDLNRIMGELRMGSGYMLKQSIKLNDIQVAGTSQPRNCLCGKLNQVWRYGGESINPTDIQLEKALEKILEWITVELN